MNRPSQSANRLYDHERKRKRNLLLAWTVVGVLALISFLVRLGAFR